MSAKEPFSTADGSELMLTVDGDFISYHSACPCAGGACHKIRKRGDDAQMPDSGPQGDMKLRAHHMLTDVRIEIAPRVFAGSEFCKPKG